MGHAKIDLVPWDPESSEHVDRLNQQRIACGWNERAVQGWQDSQRAGKIALQWVVLSESDPFSTDKQRIHTSAWPGESAPITDTAKSLGGKPRVPNPARSFIPIGHISLDSENEDPNAADPSRGIYRISNFYISRALHSAGLGRATMDEIERLAVSEPLNAKVLTLGTVANEYEGKKEKWEALTADGKVEPPVWFSWNTGFLWIVCADYWEQTSVQDWYARRGYVPYKYVDKMWSETDSKGRVWWATCVAMRKGIQ